MKRWEKNANNAAAFLAMHKKEKENEKENEKESEKEKESSSQAAEGNSDIPNLALRHGKEILLRFSIAVSREAIFLALGHLRRSESNCSENFVRRLKRAMARCVIRSLCSSKLPGAIS